MSRGKEKRIVTGCVTIGGRNSTSLYHGVLVRGSGNASVRAWVRSNFSHKKTGRSRTVPPRFLNPEVAA